MKEYAPNQPRLITWLDITSLSDVKAPTRRALLGFFSRLGNRKRLLVWSLWRQSEKSVPASLPPDDTEAKKAYNNLHRKRDQFNDLAFLAACRIVQNEEYTTKQAALIDDIKTRAAEAKRRRYAMSMKQIILRDYDLIVKLWRKYGSWSAVLQTIKRKPKAGEPDPFRDLRNKKSLTAKYLATVISVEAKFR